MLPETLSLRELVDRLRDNDQVDETQRVHVWQTVHYNPDGIPYVATYARWPFLEEETT